MASGCRRLPAPPRPPGGLRPREGTPRGAGRGWGAVEGEEERARGPGAARPAHHLRTFSMAAITRLISSFARLRVSARTDRPDMLLRGRRRPQRGYAALGADSRRASVRPSVCLSVRPPAQCSLRSARRGAAVLGAVRLRPPAGARALRTRPAPPPPARPRARARALARGAEGGASAWDGRREGTAGAVRGREFDPAVPSCPRQFQGCASPRARRAAPPVRRGPSRWPWAGCRDGGAEPRCRAGGSRVTNPVQPLCK